MHTDYELGMTNDLSLYLHYSNIVHLYCYIITNHIRYYESRLAPRSFRWSSTAMGKLRVGCYEHFNAQIWSLQHLDSRITGLAATGSVDEEQVFDSI